MVQLRPGTDPTDDDLRGTAAEPTWPATSSRRRSCGCPAGGAQPQRQARLPLGGRAGQPVASEPHGPAHHPSALRARPASVAAARCASASTTRPSSSCPTTVLRATRTPDGPATFRVEHHGDHLEVEAWGDGAEWALSMAPSALGILDDRAGFAPVAPRRGRPAPSRRRPPPTSRTQRVVEALVPAILSQRVTGFEAKRSFRQLVERWGEPAPGPGGLRLPPAPERHRRARLLRAPRARGGEEAGRHPEAGVRPRRPPRSGRRAQHRRSCASAPRGHPRRRPWTSAEVARLAHGDADAVSVGDFHLKNLVAFALAGRAPGHRRPDAGAARALRRAPGPGVPAHRVGRGLAPRRYGPRHRIEPIAGR